MPKMMMMMMVVVVVVVVDNVHKKENCNVIISPKTYKQ
jgi:hypothetical protein